MEIRCREQESGIENRLRKTRCSYDVAVAGFVRQTKQEYSSESLRSALEHQSINDKASSPGVDLGGPGAVRTKKREQAARERSGRASGTALKR